VESPIRKCVTNCTLEAGVVTPYSNLGAKKCHDICPLGTASYDITMSCYVACPVGTYIFNESGIAVCYDDCATAGYFRYENRK
jgi:hypothetical protein